MEEGLEGAIWSEEQLEEWKYHILQILTLMPLDYNRLDEIEAYIISNEWVPLYPYPKYNTKGYWPSTINGLFPEDLAIFLFFCEEKGAMRYQNYDFGYESEDYWSFAYNDSELMKDIINLTQCLVRAYSLLAAPLLQLRLELKAKEVISRKKILETEQKLIMARSQLWNDHILQISPNSPIPKIIPVSDAPANVFFDIEPDMP